MAGTLSPNIDGGCCDSFEVAIITVCTVACTSNVVGLTIALLACRRLPGIKISLDSADTLSKCCCCSYAVAMASACFILHGSLVFF